MLKVISAKKKVLIYSQDPDRIKQIDDALWSFGRNKFIPHVTVFDQEFSKVPSKRQPIFITNQQENTNEAEYLVILDEVAPKFLLTFERIFGFYNPLSQHLTAKLTKTELKNIQVNSYKRKDGGWVKES